MKILSVLFVIFTMSLHLLVISCDNDNDNTDSSILFTHGIASGDVTQDRTILWTRLSSEAEVTAEISTDCAFSEITLSQTSTASSTNDFTVKFEVADLQPGAVYCYRFKAGDTVSEIGMFKTAYAEDKDVAIRFVFTADSDGSREPPFNNFEVLDRAAQDDIDFWVYLGDTIYNDTFGAKAVTVEEMRGKYKQNRGFDALRNILRSTSTYAIWDDHEVEDDYDAESVDPDLFANGRQSFFEYMPIRESGLLSDEDCAGNPLFRVYRWGSTADIIILDERSCRSNDVSDICEGDLIPTLPSDVRTDLLQPAEPPPGCLEAIQSEERTMLGAVQKQALKQALSDSDAVWKFIMTPVAFSENYAIPYDRWEGYAAEREEILHFIFDNDIKNVVFLSGDIHTNYIADVRFNTFTDPRAVAKEIIVGPIAQRTFFVQLSELLGSDLLANALIEKFVGFADPDCIQSDAYGYGLVEADSEAVMIQLKGEDGEVLRDQITDEPCEITIMAE